MINQCLVNQICTRLICTRRQLKYCTAFLTEKGLINFSTVLVELSRHELCSSCFVRPNGSTLAPIIILLLRSYIASSFTDLPVQASQPTMTTLRLVLLLAIVCISHAAFSVKRSNRLLAEVRRTPLGRGRSLRDIRRALTVLRKEFPRCRPRVCIAVDGSASISPREFALQKNLAQVIAAVLGSSTGSRFALYEYGGIVQEISGLTPNLFGRNGFLGKARRGVQSKSRLTFVGPSIVRCGLELDGSGKIVLLGDGRSNFAPDFGRFGAVASAENWRKEGGEICAVLVGGGTPGRRFFQDIVGKPRGVSRIPKWNSVTRVMTKLVRDVCA